eukprot:7152505-Pyramimonas_sp.AAC.1
MGAGRYCAVSATHMSYRTPDSEPCEPKWNNTNPMASQIVVGSSRLGSSVCGRKPAWGWRRHSVVSHVSIQHVFEEASTWSRWVDFRSVDAGARPPGRQ